MHQPASPPSPGAPLPEPLPPAFVAGAAALLLLHVGLAWWLRQPVILTGNDDALYLLLGRAVRSLTYRDLHVLGQPWHSQYPPGYPLLLALFGGPLGLELTGPILLGLALSAIALLLCFDIARKFAPPAFALALLAALAVNPLLLDYAGSVRSETPYTAVSAAALWFLVRRDSWRGAVAAGVAFTVLAALTRSVGLALVVAVGATWVLERRWRQVAWLAGAAALSVGLWLAWIFVAPQQFDARSYGAMLTHNSPTESTPLQLLLSRAVRTLHAYFLRGSLGNALGFPRLEGTPLDNLLALAVSGGLVLAGMIASWRRGLLLTMYVVMFAGLLTVWTYKMTRFLIPLTPVLLLLAALGLAALVGARGRLVRGAGLAAFLAFFLVGGAQGIARIHRERAGCPQGLRWPVPGCLTERQGGFFEAVAFLRDSTPPEALVITTKEAVVALYTGRTVLHSQGAAGLYGKHFVDGLRSAGPAYLLLSRVHLWRLPEEMISRCREFELVRAFPDTSDIVRLRPAGTPPREDGACDAISVHAKVFVPPLGGR